jgi:hypothetical protein
MDPKTARDRSPDASLDLSQKWLRHLREAAKTTVALYCRLCPDKKVWPSEEALVAHISDAHPEKVPSKEDRDAYERFWKTLKVQPSAAAAIKTRYECPVSFSWPEHPMIS